MRELKGVTMGTRWCAKWFAPETVPTEMLADGIDQRLARIIFEMSTWEPGSLISRFNLSGAGTWHELPPDFLRVLSHALRVARDTDGAYDPACGRLIGLWGFGAGGQNFAKPPAQRAIDAAVHFGCFRSVELDAKLRRARQPGGVHLDLSSVAKGYAVDLLAEFFLESGVHSFLVEIGGELRGQGVKSDGLPWWVALEHPGTDQQGEGKREIGELVIALNGLAVATSGSSHHHFDAQGVRYSHTIDPRCGRPITHGVVSVSVVHRSCMHADALSTALTVLGPADGFDYARRLDIAARFLVDDANGVRELVTPAFAAMLA
jgi:thiamine biosynthesis lipoprotein